MSKIDRIGSLYRRLDQQLDQIDRWKKNYPIENYAYSAHLSRLYITADELAKKLLDLRYWID